MASNDQQDKNAYERRSGSSSMEFHALGSCTNSGIMKNSVPTNNGTPLPTVKCSVPSGSFFTSMVLNSNTSIGPSSINNAMDATRVIDGLVIGRSSGCSSSSSSMSYKPSATGWNASSIGGGMEGTQGIAQLACDSAFAERAARFSCIGAFNLSEGGFPRSRIDNSVMPKIPKPNANMVEVTKAAGSPPKEEAYNADNGPRKAGRLSRSSTPGGNESDDAEASTGREDSSSSEHVTGDVTTVGRKRKLMKQLPKDLSASEAGINIKSMEGSEMNYLKYKASEGLVEKDDVKGQGEQSSSKNGKLNTSKEDYFHVRAKRGQATNSHSLAERVRREKISERMKFLQDLVPGCSKVTGKAVMLDEIINYVQSLQRQVEFLSMKLAAVNPRLDFNIEALIAKDSRSSLSTMVCPPDTRMSYPHLHQPQHGLLQVGTEGHSVNQAEALRRSVNSQLGCIDGYGDAIAQLSNVWDDELQSIVQMGFGQNIQTPFKSQGNSSTIPSSNMKSEL